MNAALYVRKSTDDERSSEDGRSIDRQTKLAGDFAAKQGWAVAEVFSDDGISGGEFHNRPGFRNLMAAAQRRPRPFDAVVTMGLNRLGRDQARVSMALTDLHDAGVAVWTYQRAAEIKLDTPTEILIASVEAFADAAYRETCRVNAREALREKAGRGHATGARTFGYRLERVGEHSERRIDPEQAAIVTRIFELSAAGYGDLKIVKTLNDEGVPAPHSTSRTRKVKRPDGTVTRETIAHRWAKDLVRGLVANRLYVGEVVYGKTRVVAKGGSVKKRERVPEDDWHRLTIPELRIVPDELWSRVQAIKSEARAKWLRRNDGKLIGRPEGVGGTAPHVLSGIGRCHECGGPLAAVTKNPKSGPHYRCAARTRTGQCSNGRGIPAPALDAAVIERLTEFPSNDAVIDLFAERIRAARKAEAVQAETRRAMEREAERVQAAIERLTDAIEAGQPVGDRLKQRRAELDGLRAKLAAADEPALGRDDVAARLAEIPVANGDPFQARQILRLVGLDRITVNTETGEFSGDADFRGVFRKSALAGTRSLAARCARSRGATRRRCPAPATRRRYGSGESAPTPARRAAWYRTSDPGRWR